MKQRVEAVARLSGVIEDGACGQISQEPGRPIQAEGGLNFLDLRQEKNNWRSAWMGVGEAHSSEEAG
jgi:hypothetical protein